MLDGTCNPVMNKSDKYYPKVPFIRNLFSVFEWQRLIVFLSISKLSVCGYILLSIVADILVVVAPALIIFSVTAGNSPAESNDFPANLIDTVPLYISFILAFLSIFLQQCMVYIKTLLIRTIDLKFFNMETNRILEIYRKTEFYKNDVGNSTKRAWFSKNLSRNVRHTSEAMQAQLKIFPETLSIGLALVFLMILNWIAALVVVSILVITSLLLVKQSTRIYTISESYFGKQLPEFSNRLGKLLNHLYRLPIEIYDKQSLEPEFTKFLESRYKLRKQRALLDASSSIIVSALILGLIYFTVIASRREDLVNIELLAFQVVLMMQIMNKARSIFGSVGGVSSFFPQIKMSRDIENSLLVSQEHVITRESSINKDLPNKLPFILHLKGNGVITRFNYLNLLERVEELFIDSHTLGTEYLPGEQTILITSAVIKDHFRHLEKIPNQIYPHIMQLIDYWVEVGKNIFVIDWRLLNECNVTDIVALSNRHKSLKIIVATNANIPKVWIKTLGENFSVFDWSDPTLKTNSSETNTDPDE